MAEEADRVSLLAKEPQPEDVLGREARNLGLGVHSQEEAEDWDEAGVLRAGVGGGCGAREVGLGVRSLLLDEEEPPAPRFDMVQGRRRVAGRLRVNRLGKKCLGVRLGQSDSGSPTSRVSTFEFRLSNFEIRLPTSDFRTFDFRAGTTDARNSWIKFSGIQRFDIFLFLK